MQKRLLIISLLLCFVANAQRTHSYYQSGRPLSIAMNNALMISAAEWSVEFVYVSDSLAEHIGNEEINQRNELTSVYMAHKSDLGEDWLNKIYDLATLEEQRHNLFRSWIRQDDDYEEMATMLFEPILLFTKKKALFGEYYRAYLVGQLKTDDTRKFGTYATYKVYLKKARIKSVKTRGELPFTLPQNGIQ
jgi:hypothetical protein